MKNPLTIYKQEINLNKKPKKRIKYSQAEKIARKLIRNVVKAHKSCKISIDPNDVDKFPELVGDRFHYTFYNPRWYTINGVHKQFPQNAVYHPSTERIEVGYKFFNELKNLSSKKAGNYSLLIDEHLIKIPNANVAKFLILKYPNSNSTFKLI